MKNLHQVNINALITDRHWAAARWLKGRYIKIVENRVYWKYNQNDSFQFWDWGDESWAIVVNEWKVYRMPKTDELRELIIL